MSAQRAGRAELPEWGAPEPRPDRSPLPQVAAGAVVVVAIGVLLALVQPLVAAAWISLVAIAGSVLVRRAAVEGTVGLAGTRAVSSSSRLGRLVAGLAGDLGIPEPEVRTYDGPPNAVVTNHRGHSLVSVSAELVDGYGLTELEAVVAHCLVRARAGVPGRSWTRWVPGWTRRVSPCAPASFDVRTSSLTRYPPGLASAIRKATPRDGRDQGLWFVPRAADPCSPDARAELLEDL